MKKQLLFLLCTMLFGATSVWAEDGDLFEAPVQVIKDGETTTVPMLFQVINEADKLCQTYGNYDEVTETRTPAIDPTVEGEVIIPQTVNGYMVSHVGEASFWGCSFSQIKLPETIILKVFFILESFQISG